MFHARQAWFLVPGCFAKQPGKVSCSFPFPVVYGLPRSGTVFGPWLLAQQLGGRSTVFRARQAWFLSLAALQSSQERFPVSFPSPSFLLLFILTIYLGSLAATQSSQGGQRSAKLGGCGFQSLAARAAARGAVYGVPRSAGVVFGPWLLCKATRDGLPFLSLPLFFFWLPILTIYSGWSTVCHAGCSFRSLAAREAARRAVDVIPRSAGVVFGPCFFPFPVVYGLPCSGAVFGPWLLVQ